jgi:phage virion morphogenesis protein
LYIVYQSLFDGQDRMTEISIRLDDSDINAKLQAIQQKARNLEPALKIIGERMLRHTEDRFDAQKDPEGRAWAPLRQSTREQKKNPKILTERGHLRGSIRDQVQGNTLRVGTNRIYGAVHQLGGKAHEIKPKNKKALAWPGARHPVRKVMHPGVPARPFLGIGLEDKKDILEVLDDYLEVQQ